MFDGLLTETTVNLNALFIQEKLNYQLRIFKEGEKQQKIKKYLSWPSEKKDFNRFLAILVFLLKYSYKI